MAFPLQQYYSRIYKTYDLVNRLFTFGQDRRWRKQTVAECLAGNPKRVLDLCCGTGDLALGLAETGGPLLGVTGFDLNAEMLAVARQKALERNLERISFLQGDAGNMPFTRDEFDCITIGFGFRNLVWENPSAEKHMSEISRVLTAGGKLLILESAVPGNSLVRFFYRVYLNIVLVPLGGLLSGDWQAYKYLAGSSSGFYDYDTLSRMLNNVSLQTRSRRKYLFGSVNLIVATKSGTSQAVLS